MDVGSLVILQRSKLQTRSRQLSLQGRTDLTTSESVEEYGLGCEQPDQRKASVWNGTGDPIELRKPIQVHAHQDEVCCAARREGTPDGPEVLLS